MKSILVATASLLALASLAGCAETSAYGGHMDREAQLRDRITTADARDARMTPAIDEAAATRGLSIAHVSEATRSAAARNR